MHGFIVQQAVVVYQICFGTWTNVPIVGKTICACWLSHSPSLVRACGQLQAIAISCSIYHWYKSYCIAWNINGIMNLAVWQFSENRPNLIPHQYLDHYWIKMHTLYVVLHWHLQVYMFMLLLSIRLALLQYPQREDLCAEVLHILSKWDETGEGCTKWLLANKLGMKRNLQCLQWLYPWEQDNGKNEQYQKVPAKAGAQKSKTTVKRLTLSMPVAILWRHQLMGLEIRQI